MLDKEESQTHCFNPFIVQITVFSLATNRDYILNGICNDALKFMGDRFSC